VSVQEILVPHAGVIVPVSQVRSTLLQGSIEGLKRHGSYQAWLGLVDPLYRDQLIEAIGPSWLPVEVGMAHYDACDRLALGDREIAEIGASVGERLQGTLLGIAAKIARNAGVTPEVAMQYFQRLWPRLFTGGSMQVKLTGRKDMTLELRGARLAQFRYFRGSFCGNVLAATKLLGVRTAHTRQLPYDAAQDRFVVQLSWV
jgi:hypothetical protein